MSKRLVCWNNKEHCTQYHKSSGWENGLEGVVDRSMKFGNRIKFRDQAHIEEFENMFDVRVY